MQPTTLTILLAEDNPGHSRLIERNLRRIQLTDQVKIFRNGKTLLEFLQNSNGHIKNMSLHKYMILLDLALPVVDGFEVLKSIKSNENTRHIPVVIITSNGDPEEMSRCYENGCDGYIVKSVRYTQFRDSFNNLLALMEDKYEKEDKTRILHMEDNAGIAALLKKQLSQFGYHIDRVADGKEGLKAYKEFPYDLVIVDYKMPGMSGLEVLRKLGNNRSLPPSILLTGDGNEEIAVEAMKMGVGDYLVKDSQGKYLQLLPYIIKETLEKHRLKDEKKHMQAKLQLKAEELQRSNQELQKFAHIISHDLKEPLHSIRGFVKLFEGSYRGQLDDQADEFIDFITDGTDRMARLIDGILEYSRMDGNPINQELVDCNLLLKSVCENLDAVISEKKATVEYDTLPTVMGDNIQLLRLFQNLIENGIKYCTKAKPVVKISAEAEEGFVKFAIRDNGIGIKAKDKDEIFMIFQRAVNRDDFPGDGLGLATCKKIVEKHLGKIWVDSKPGRGSTFYVTLPEISVSESTKTP